MYKEKATPIGKNHSIESPILIKRSHGSNNSFKATLIEKANESLKSYKNVKASTVFFPGCNFAGYFPNMITSVSAKLDADFGIPTVYDCCSKSVAMLKDKSEIKTCGRHLKERVLHYNIKEMIVVCPNCYYHLKKILDIKISLLYEHDEIMSSLITNSSKDSINGHLFIPCPDKKTREIYTSLEKYVDFNKLSEIRNIACCGAGIISKSKDVFKKIDKKFRTYNDTINNTIYVYCASCQGAIMKSHKNVKHILAELMGLNEKAEIGVHSYKNRFLFKMKNTFK